MDRYDRAIAFLTEHPSEIFDAWCDPDGHVAGCLFVFCAPFNASDRRDDRKLCGCLTQVARFDTAVAWTDELTAEIRADNRIPSEHEITVADLPVFAEWQRKLDIALNRDWSVLETAAH